MEKSVITFDSGIDPIDKTNMIAAVINETNIQTGEVVSYRDQIDISNGEIVRKNGNGYSYKTASALVGDYQDKFISILESGKDVVHIAMSSGISEGSVNSPFLVANELNDEYENKIYVVDSLNGATGGTLLSIIALELAKKGMSATNIVSHLNNIKKKLSTCFYVPNPEGFIKSGRNKSEMCLKDRALLMGVKTAMLGGIKFRVDFSQEGNLFTKRVIKGNTKKGMEKFLSGVINEDNKDSFDDSIVVVGSVLENKVNMADVVAYLEYLDYFKSVVNVPINGVVACYGSEDLCGISLIKK